MATARDDRKMLTDKQLKVLREKLEEERSRLVFKASAGFDDNLKAETMSDEIDQANADHMNAQQLRFRNREIFYDKKIVEALRRMDQGEYGLCEECGGPIGFSRLMARPTAEKCIVCKEESERDEFNNINERRPKSQGTAMNYVRTI